MTQIRPIREEYKTPFWLNWLKHSATMENNKVQLKVKVTRGFKYPRTTVMEQEGHLKVSSL